MVGEVAAGMTLAPGSHLARGPATDLPDAGWIGRLAVVRLVGRSADSGDGAVEPLYVRPPDATPACPPRREVG